MYISTYLTFGNILFGCLRQVGCLLEVTANTGLTVFLLNVLILKKVLLKDFIYCITILTLLLDKKLPDIEPSRYYYVCNDIYIILVKMIKSWQFKGKMGTSYIENRRKSPFALEPFNFSRNSQPKKDLPYWVLTNESQTTIHPKPMYSQPELAVTFIKQPYRMFPYFYFVLIFTSAKQPPAQSNHFLCFLWVASKYTFDLAFII